jgi:large subunit ribosomal protein L32
VAVPKRRRTSSRRDMRRAQHDKVTAPNLIPCPNCSAPIVTHRVCATCGYYKGKQIVDVGSKEKTET